MSEVTITLRGKAAERLERLVKEERFPSAEEAVAEALEALEISQDPELDAWLRDVIAPRIEAMDRGETLTSEELRARLFGK